MLQQLGQGSGGSAAVANQVSSLLVQEPLSLVTLVVNLGIGAVMSLGLRWHFKRFGSTLANRDDLGNVFPFILLTTLLIITVVKSSLALSLGLVGALSIVRFRTPIKEPEELAYLFIAISIGLGLGANQTVATVVASGIILGVMTAVKLKTGGSREKNLYLSVEWARTGAEGKGGQGVEVLNAEIARHVVESDLRRLQVRDGGLEAIYYVQLAGPAAVGALVEGLRQRVPEIGITFIDQNQMPSV